MRTIGDAEAKSGFDQLLDQVQAGEEVVITRRGVAVARLAPPGAEGDDHDRARAAARRIRTMRRGVTLDGLSIKDLIAEGRQ